MIKSRGFRWAEHVVRIREDRRALKFWTGKPRARYEDNIGKDLKKNRNHYEKY